MYTFRVKAALYHKGLITTIIIIFYSLYAQAQKIESIDSVLAGMSLEDKIGMILIPFSPLKDDGETAGSMRFKVVSPDTLVSSAVKNDSSTIKLLDTRDGFLTSSLLPPFPDDHAIATLKQNNDKSVLARDLLSHLCRKGYSGVLASSDYLFEEMSPVSKSTRKKDKYPLSVWLPVGDEIRAARLPVTFMPEELFARNESHFEIQTVGTDVAHSIFWAPTIEALKSEFSFQKRLKEGYLFLTNNYQKDFNRLYRAYQAKWLYQEELDKRCRKVLEVLYGKLGCKQIFDQDVRFIELLRIRALEGGVHLFQDNQSVFPITDMSKNAIAVVADEEVKFRDEFSRMAKRYDSLSDEPEEANLVFWLAGNNSLSAEWITTRVQNIRQKFKGARVVMFWAGHQRHILMKQLPPNLNALITGSSNHAFVWETMAQAAFSGIEVDSCRNNGDWPHNLADQSSHFARTRLKYGVPLESGLHPDSLLKIDEIVREAISDKAMPGARVLVACRGVVVWDRAYGHHTYQRKQEVKADDLYDLASVTKITATLPALMKLYDESKWSLSDTLAKFFPEADTTDKSAICLEDLLRHQSGLPAFIPFYINAIDREKVRGSLFSRRYSSLYSIKLDNRIYLNRTVAYRSDIFHQTSDSLFSVPVAQSWFLNRHYLDSIRAQVLMAPLRTHHEYLYSDLGFYFLGELVPRLSGLTMDRYLSKEFYNPLGANKTLFLPLTRFPVENIVPTEQDDAFRKQLLRGWVHDPGAAMMGGVAGHAGLFSNAEDLAIIMQMFLNKGSYGGIRFLNPTTIDFFTQSHVDSNRRGLGFDKPNMDDPKKSPASGFASEQSYGHSGFTGTLVWADPAVDLIFVFLSNRVYPHQYNKKLIENNIRTRVHDAIYRSLIIKEEKMEPVLQKLEARKPKVISMQN